MGATLGIGITAGGLVTLVYGIMLIFILGGSSALSMAEIAAVYPTAGGQYHWTSILAPSKSTGIALSYVCGVAIVFAWTENAASVMTAAPQMFLSLASLWNPGYEPATVHVFLIYQRLNMVFIAYNIFLIRRTA
jgi:choline transport protein